MNRFLGMLAVTSLIAAGIVHAQSAMSNTAPTAPIKPIEPAQPAPDSEADDTADITLDPASLLPDLPALPRTKATVIGGTIESIDRVQDQLTMRVFGGGRMSFLFDTRTHILRDGNPATTTDLKPGESVYADTILANGKVFARNIRLRGAVVQGETQGVLVSYRSDRNELVVRDPISPQPLRLRITPSTQILREDQPASTRDLLSGSLISVKFAPSGNGHDTVSEVSILAAQGQTFTFGGRVITLDLRSGLLVLTSPLNHKTYEIVLDPSVIPVAENLREGAQVTVTTRFDGNRYIALSLAVEPITQPN